MKKKGNIIFKIFFAGLPVFLLAFLLCTCGSSPDSNNSGGASSGASPDDAIALAQNALNRMDGGGNQGLSSGNQNVSSENKNPSSGNNASSANSGQQNADVKTATGRKPAWVDSLDSVYSRAVYVAAVGQASSREMAEKNALANLTAYFGQSIKADTTITNLYQEAVRNGVTASWSDNVNMRNTITTSASLDTLVGTEIKQVWYDSRSVYYAAAVMEKTAAAAAYREIIIANQNMISNLIAMTPTEKNSLEGYSRYQFAAAVADINSTYVNVIKMLGSSPPDGLLTGNDYRLEAQNITKAIPVGVFVKNDKSGRIQGAFSKAVSDLGFRTGGNNSRYVIDVDVTVSPVDLPNSSNFVYSRIEMTANLKDNSAGGAVLLPFNYNTRAGHTSKTEAENRAYMEAERKISADYKDILSDYLSQALPKK